VVDVANDPGGRERLMRLGVRSVPVVAQGERYVFAQSIEDVAEFVGIAAGEAGLRPDALVVKWLTVLDAARSDIAQIPDERIGERVIDNRDRSIRALGYHVFRIGEAFLETAEGGLDYADQTANTPPPDTVRNGRDIADYGAKVRARIERWWQTTDDRDCTASCNTYYGKQPLHRLLERSAWHSAQHVRQTIAVLERFGIEPAVRLSSEDLAGLPLPEGLWE
jgi:hypothetical protein